MTKVAASCVGLIASQSRIAKSGKRRERRTTKKIQSWDFRKMGKPSWTTSKIYQLSSSKNLTITKRTSSIYSTQRTIFRTSWNANNLTAKNKSLPLMSLPHPLRNANLLQYTNPSKRNLTINATPRSAIFLLWMRS